MNHSDDYWPDRFDEGAGLHGNKFACSSTMTKKDAVTRFYSLRTRFLNLVNCTFLQANGLT